VRIEELINYFIMNISKPQGEILLLSIQRSPIVPGTNNTGWCWWRLTGKKIPVENLHHPISFPYDVSGSMDDQ